MSEDRDIPDRVWEMIERGMRELKKGNVGKRVNTSDMEEDFPGLFDDDKDNINKDES